MWNAGFVSALRFSLSAVLFVLDIREGDRKHEARITYLDHGSYPAQRS